MPLELSDRTDPFALFCEWFAEASLVEQGEVNAMVLATGTRLGRVASRVVLLKDYSPANFVFYTNYGSAKARDLAENPYAALLFYWRVLGRQVRITGSVSRVSEANSDAYFSTRPPSAQLGAWASRQSRVLPSREVLEEDASSIAQRFGEDSITRPDFWGGFSVKPQRYEFWQGADESRMHDRFVFEEDGYGGFSRCRLYP